MRTQVQTVLNIPAVAQTTLGYIKDTLFNNDRDEALADEINDNLTASFLGGYL